MVAFMAKPKHLKKLRQDVVVWNAWRKSAGDYPGPDVEDVWGDPRQNVLEYSEACGVELDEYQIRDEIRLTEPGSYGCSQE